MPSVAAGADSCADAAWNRLVLIRKQVMIFPGAATLLSELVSRSALLKRASKVRVTSSFESLTTVCSTVDARRSFKSRVAPFQEAQPTVSASNNPSFIVACHIFSSPVHASVDFERLKEAAYLVLSPSPPSVFIPTSSTISNSHQPLTRKEHTIRNGSQALYRRVASSIQIEHLQNQHHCPTTSRKRLLLHQ